MTPQLLAAALVAVATVAPCSPGDPSAGLAAAERAFAATMGERDLDGFRSHLADDAVFLSPSGALRGPDRIVEAWSGFFDGERAPFSWRPEVAEVTGDGRVGFTAGPVLAPDGRRVGSFNSVWRCVGGRWEIVFDRGCPPCPELPEVTVAPVPAD